MRLEPPEDMGKGKVSTGDVKTRGRGWVGVYEVMGAVYEGKMGKVELVCCCM